MPDPIVYGFPRSTFVNIIRLILTQKDVAYTFHDLEPDMGGPEHLALHPFDRVPILQHGDSVLYETSAIVAYLEEPLATPRTPNERRPGADEPMDRRGQFLLLPVHDLSRHARTPNVFPELGIASDETVVAHALPKIEVGSRRTCSSHTAKISCSAMSSRSPTLPTAKHLFVRPHPRGQDDVRELSRLVQRGANGWTPCRRRNRLPRVAAAPPDRTRAEMGELAPAEILTTKSLAAATLRR